MSPAATSASVSFFEDGVAVDPVYDAIRAGENDYAREARDLPSEPTGQKKNALARAT